MTASNSYESWFDRALESVDAEYLEAEQQIRSLPDPRSALADRLDDDDPTARTLARAVIQDSEAAEPEIRVLDEYLDAAERRFAGTVAGTPPVRAVVANLSARFGGRLAEVLAVRLVRLPSAAAWRSQAALAYLERHPDPATTELLLRYAATTPSVPLRTAALRALRSSGDPALARKAAAEQQRLAAAGQPVPAALVDLAAARA